MAPVFPISYQFPLSEILRHFEESFPSMKEWEADEEFRRKWLADSDSNFVSGFFVDHRPDDSFLMGIAGEFCRHYGLEDNVYSTQLLCVAPNVTLPWHEDGVPAFSAINCLLGPEPAPVEFQAGLFFYSTAVLNVRQVHRVVNGPAARPMFRIVFHNEEADYESVVDKIRGKLRSGDARGPL